MNETQQAILLPDSPVRKERWYQVFSRLPRPALEWVTVIGVLYALVIGPAFVEPLAEGYLVQVLLFAGALFGVRAVEQIKGVNAKVEASNVAG